MLVTRTGTYDLVITKSSTVPWRLQVFQLKKEKRKVLGVVYWHPQALQALRGSGAMFPWENFLMIFLKMPFPAF
mgnify:CR=1 FL=1